MGRISLALLCVVLTCGVAQAERRGEGDTFQNLTAIAAATDKPLVYVLESSGSRLIEVDAMTGDRRLIADLSGQAGGVTGIAYVPGSGHVLVRTGHGRLFDVSAKTGAKREVAYTSTDKARETGEAFIINTEMVVSPDGRTAYFIDKAQRPVLGRDEDYLTLLAVDIETGATAQVRREPDDPTPMNWIEPHFSIFSGNIMLSPLARVLLASAPDGSLYVLHGDRGDWSDNVVDPASARTRQAIHGGNTDDVLQDLRAVAVDEQFIFFADARLRSVLRAPLGSASWDALEIVSGWENRPDGEQVAAGPAIVFPVDMDSLPDGELVVGDGHHNAIIGVDPMTGERRLISGETRPYVPEREPISMGLQFILCEDAHNGSLEDLRKTLTGYNWEIDDAYPMIRCSDTYGSSSSVDLIKYAASVPSGTSLAVSLARYYIRELEQPERIADIYNTIDEVPGWHSGTFIDFLRFHRDNPAWSDTDRDTYDRVEALARRFGAKTQAELDNQQ
ncbi:lactonase family protein [Henriciella litoralis]|uniref:PQQ-binding-like beta-propeller repeat protein n=1 Tax=Henriciella litoralis TaxID=568102 RepID=UPI00111C1011|nr:PQQ-binding-like beta-propeller repeat protein [Henriciella litoralis]